MFPLATLGLLCAGAVFYGRPWWAIGECTRGWLALAGVRSEYVQLGPYRLHYYVGGQGPPLVLLHGLGARGRELVRSDRRLDAPRPSGSCPGPARLRPFERPDVDYSIALQTQVLEQFLASRDLERADLGGWSMAVGWIKLRLTTPNACAALSRSIARG